MALIIKYLKGWRPRRILKDIAKIGDNFEQLQCTVDTISVHYTVYIISYNMICENGPWKLLLRHLRTECDEHRSNCTKRHFVTIDEDIR